MDLDLSPHSQRDPSPRSSTQNTAERDLFLVAHALVTCDFLQLHCHNVQGDTTALDLMYCALPYGTTPKTGQKLLNAINIMIKIFFRNVRQLLTTYRTDLILSSLFYYFKNNVFFQKHMDQNYRHAERII